MPDLAADRDAIRHLLAVYTYNGDRGRIDALAACFAEDGVLEFTGKAPRGPAAIAEALTSGDRNPAVTFVRHHVTNPLIEVTGDSAEARSYFAVTSDNGPDHSGTYTDRLVRTAGGWRIAYRRVRIDWQAASSIFAPRVTR